MNKLTIALLLFPLFLQAQKVKKVTCGHYRWDVKTMTDKIAVDTSATFEPIEYFNSLPRPKIHKGIRDSVETKTYTVEGTIFYWHIELDNDIHIAIRSLIDTTKTMVCEIPYKLCSAKSKVLNQLIEARAKFLSYTIPHTTHVQPGIYDITGVLFFDETIVYGKPHRVTGHSLNYSELHPVIRIDKVK